MSTTITANSNRISINYLLGNLRRDQFSTAYPMWSLLPYDSRYSHQFPFFTLGTIQVMLRDPRINFGLALIKGPICTYTKFFSEEESEKPGIQQLITELHYHFPYGVRCKNKKQEQYIIRQLKRLWETSIFQALECIDWGYAGCEVKYRKNDEYGLELDRLLNIANQNRFLQCIVHNGGIVGFSSSVSGNKLVPLGKGLWFVHQSNKHPYYGQSQLLGAHIPWHETWMLGGARDVRRTWFFKNAYEGGTFYYPEGSYTDENGVVRPNEELAVRMAELKRTGSSTILPSTKGLDGKRSWEYEPPKANITPQGMIEWVELLRDEELEGLGIPPEVISNSGSQGMGAATGRMVPLLAWIATLTPISLSIINAFKDQILDRILLRANGFKDDYEIFSIVPINMEVPQGGGDVLTKTVSDSGVG